MGKISYLNPPKQYSEIRNGTVRMNENNDCTIVAIALVSGKTYEEVHATLKKLGRIDRRGTPRWMNKSALTQLKIGYRIWSVQQLAARYPGRLKTELKTVTTLHPRRFPGVFLPGEKWLLVSARHITAVVDGTTHDWAINNPLRVSEIIQILEVK